MKVTSFLTLLVFISCSSPKPLTANEDLFEARGDKLHQCYLESDLYQIKKPGKMEVSYQVLPDGKVKDVKVSKTSFKDANFVACITGRIQDLKYLPAKDGEIMSYHYPLNFQAKANR